MTFLFKYLSFSQTTDQRIHINDENEELDKERTINVFFNVLKGRVYDGFMVKIDPHNSVVDHVFRYFERENRQVNLVLPALYYFTQTPITK